MLEWHCIAGYLSQNLGSVGVRWDQMDVSLCRDPVREGFGVVIEPRALGKARLDWGVGWFEGARRPQLLLEEEVHVEMVQFADSPNHGESDFELL